MSISELYRTTIQTSVSPAGGLKGRNEIGPEAPEKLKLPSEFEQILNRERVVPAPGISLSQHAETRIRSREIPWSSALEKRISSGMDQAQAKGSREALILADDVAVIANVKSRTVVTAMDRTQLKERIFTNIDSAVLV